MATKKAVTADAYAAAMATVAAAESEMLDSSLPILTAARDALNKARDDIDALRTSAPPAVGPDGGGRANINNWYSQLQSFGAQVDQMLSTLDSVKGQYVPPPAAAPGA